MGRFTLLLRFTWNKICLLVRDLLVFRVETVVVHTVQGDLRGKKCTSVLGKPYFSFRGIPYAKPPLGLLRFKDPVPVERWEGVRSALKEGPVSCQFDKILRMVIGSEDCLYLNVYTPQLPAENSDHSPKAVMVWIHGGAFAMGSGNSEFYGPDFFLEEDVILVTLNYRLGALGFLGTGTEDVPGNAGLKDMVMALRWVQQNISVMGGDPAKVCVFGESAGGAAVHYLLMSPLCKGLFSSAISQSGSALTPWAWASDAVANAFQLGKALGCDTNDPKVLINHLRNIPPSDLTKKKHLALPEENRRELIPFGFVPCDEPESPTALITKHPLILLKEGHINQVPYITGCNEMEGMIILKQLFDGKPHWRELEEDFERFVPRYLKLEPGSDKKKQASQKMREFYMGGKAVDKRAFAECCNMTTDVFYMDPMTRTTEYMTANSTAPVFNYYFRFDGEFKLLKRFIGVDFPGPTHADEIGYLFYMPVLGQRVNRDSQEMKVSARMARMWCNFAKTHNPTPDEDPDLQVKWGPAQPNKRLYLEITNELTIKQDMEKNRMDFWSDLHKFSDAN